MSNKKTSEAKCSSSDKFSAVVETASMDAAALSGWCREHGVHPDQLAAWRSACAQANDSQVAHQKNLKKRCKDDRQKIAVLERELRRKEKALAEASALLVLRKKVQAIWGASGGE